MLEVVRAEFKEGQAVVSTSEDSKPEETQELVGACDQALCFVVDALKDTI